MRRHDFDPIAFIFGIAFSGLGILFMTDRLDLLNHAQWLWPGLLVLLGLAVLVGARGRGGARAPRPAMESRVPLDPAREDELLHAPITTIDSGSLADTRDLFKLRPGTPEREAEEEATAEVRPRAPEEPEAAEQRTEVLPEVDPEADTTVLPEREAKREQDHD